MKEETTKTNKPVSAGTKKKASRKSGITVWEVFKTIGVYIFKCRALLISLPVLLVSIFQAAQNSARLPEEVGINLLATGEYAKTVSRPTAVLIPLLITIGCIVLTCCSKRTLFPWLISIFSLVLPILIWLTNIYPM